MEHRIIDHRHDNDKLSVLVYTMKRRKARPRRLPCIILCSLTCVYLWFWVRLSNSPGALPPSMVVSNFDDQRRISQSSSSGRVRERNTALVVSENHPSSKGRPYVVPDSDKGTTLIVAFCNYHFRNVGILFYERMTRLGYNNHLLVATDPEMVEFLEQYDHSSPIGQIRYQVWIHEPLPGMVLSWPKPKQDHAYLELLMAVRWKYLLQQLEHGMHIVLTDVDNIFTGYIDVDQEMASRDTDIDVWHAYATKFPRKAFAKQGFCVCSGMSWWRASPAAIRMARLMRDTCGDMCDDQRELNNLLSSSPALNMTWHWTEQVERSRLTNATTNDPRFLGLPTTELSGHSDVTGHTARIWNRDFAFRGPLLPDICPTNNWVSMPILQAKSRQTAWKAKVESFEEWDQHCGKNNEV